MVVCCGVCYGGYGGVGNRRVGSGDVCYGGVIVVLGMVVEGIAVCGVWCCNRCGVLVWGLMGGVHCTIMWA